MDKFVIRTKRVRLESSASLITQGSHDVQQDRPGSGRPQNQVDVNLDELVADPGLRPSISTLACNPKEREKIQRAYLLRGPFQPRLESYPLTEFSGRIRRFNPNWYKEYGSWLEYSEHKDAVFCLCCYLFQVEYGGQKGQDSFVVGGFRNWKKKNKLDAHVWDHNSSHMKCMMACQSLMNQSQQSKYAQENSDLNVLLNASVRCVKLILQQGLPIYGLGGLNYFAHDSDDSYNEENFLELLKFISEHDDKLNEALSKDGSRGNRFITHSLQKDIASTSAFLTSNSIIKDIGDGMFSLIVGEVCGAFYSSYLTFILRYVDRTGYVVERFLGIIQVDDIDTHSIKEAVDSLFAKHGLDISRIRGQCYVGASNMFGEFHKLKSLLLAENKCAIYFHCFAHKLHLTLAAVASKRGEIYSFFKHLSMLSDVAKVAGSYHDVLKEKQAEKILDKVSSEDFHGSHYGTIQGLVAYFPQIVHMLETIEDIDKDIEGRLQSKMVLDFVFNFEFAFTLHLMDRILGLTEVVSQQLLMKDPDLQGLMNAITSVKTAKQLLENLKECGWENLWNETCDFCNVNDIDIPKTEDMYKGRLKRRYQQLTVLQYFQVELFGKVIDDVLQELNDLFDDVNTKFLACVGCLDPTDTFAAYDKQQLIQFAELYPFEFGENDLLELDSQLDNYITYVRNDDDFSNMKTIGELARKLVEKKKDTVYPLVYLLVKLALILPVMTATIERSKSITDIIKTSLSVQTLDAWLNDCFVTYIEWDIFEKIETEAIIHHLEERKPAGMVCTEAD